MPFLSIKWKLSVVFILISSLVIAMFLWTAKEVFEKDKIAYVFDTQQSRISFLARTIRNQFEQTVFESKLIASEYEPTSQSFSETARRVFDARKRIRWVGLYSHSQGQWLGQLSKDENLPAPAPPGPELKKFEVQIPSEGQALILVPFESNDGPMASVSVVDLKDLVPAADLYAGLALQRMGKIVQGSFHPETDLRDPMLELLSAEPSQALDATSLKDSSYGRFFVARAQVGISGLEVIALVSSEEALKALKTLMKRSSLFLVFALFMVTAVSILIAIGFTKDLEKLRVAAEQISVGKFLTKALVQSKDEFGILSRAFEKMSKEIQRLLLETKDKARMESELKTARLVQESLFPERATEIVGDYMLHGFSMSSTECGGDWWYYFSTNQYLYLAIGDATGHGTPAALITAAARSVFSKIERKPEDNLNEMMKDWDLAITACSKSRVFMTGILVRIELETGKAQLLNASHEMPILVKPLTPTDYEVSFLDLQVGATLGENSSEAWVITELTIEPDSSLVLYTDGLTAIQNPAGKTISERKLLQITNKVATSTTNPVELTQSLAQEFESFRQNTPLPDDVTIMTVKRSGPGALAKTVSA